MHLPDSFLVKGAEGGVAFEPGAYPSAQRGEAALVFEGRIDRLRADAPPLGGQSPSAVALLLLEAFLREGDVALARAEGDFIAVIARPCDVLAWKSFAASRQLFIAERQRAVSNRLLPLALAGASEPDPIYRDRFIVGTPSLLHALPETPLAGVRRVLPGHLVTLSPSGVAERQLVRRAWRYHHDRRQGIREAGLRVRELLVRGVEERLLQATPGDICCELSGGLDSSFIACLVGARASHVKAYMFARPDLPSFRASEGYARSVADRYGLDLAILTPSDLPVVDLKGEHVYSDEPSDFFWFGQMFGRAAAARLQPASTLFNGFGADQLFLRSPRVVPHLLRQGLLREGAAVLRDFARYAQRSEASLALQTALSMLPRSGYRKLVRPFAGRRLNPFYVGDVNPDWEVRSTVPWLRGGEMASAEGLERVESLRLAADARLIGDGIVCDDLAYLAASTAVYAPFMAPKQIREESPYCDLPLMDYVYGEISVHLVHDFRGRYKELLRVAQEGIVPEELRNRAHDTFVFDSFRSDFLKKNHAAFVDLMASSDALRDQGTAPWVDGPWVDRRGLAESFEQLTFGVQTSATRAVLTLLGYLVWWRDFQVAVKRSRGAADRDERPPGSARRASVT
ncbi:MAG: asparagine synthase [Myxococcales bacterium]|nr:asparagine synthase [Myxococcales bacterium]